MGLQDAIKEDLESLMKGDTGLLQAARGISSGFFHRSMNEVWQVNRHGSPHPTKEMRQLHSVRCHNEIQTQWRCQCSSEID